MRSIGTKNINLVKRLTKEAIERKKSPYSSILDTPNYHGIEEEVIDKLPVELWDTWEMADQQIRRIVGDTIGTF